MIVLQCPRCGDARPVSTVPDLDRDAGGEETRARPPLPGEPTFRATRPGITRPGALAMIALLTGCASLGEFAAKADRYRRELVGLVEAAQAVVADCKTKPDPKPALCEHAERIIAAAEPEIDGGGR